MYGEIVEFERMMTGWGVYHLEKNACRATATRIRNVEILMTDEEDAADEAALIKSSQGPENWKKKKWN